MERRIATDRSQSDRLLRCGVSADTADMCYDSGALSLMGYDSAVHERDSRRESYEVIPAWSLSRLLELIPMRIIGRKNNYYEFRLERLCTGVDKWKIEWRSYEDFLSTYDSKGKPWFFLGNTPIEACIEAIEWLTENNYKLNEQ